MFYTTARNFFLPFFPTFACLSPIFRYQPLLWQQYVDVNLNTLLVNDFLCRSTCLSFTSWSSANLTFLLCIGLVSIPLKDRDLARLSKPSKWCCVSTTASFNEESDIHLFGCAKGTFSVIAGFIDSCWSYWGWAMLGALLHIRSSCSLLMLWKIRVKAWSISLW